MLPLLATQILWINLVTDGAPALALGVDPADEGLMQQPPRPVGERVITPRMWRGIVFVGVIMAAGTLFVLDASLPGGLSKVGRPALCTDDGVHDADAVSDVQRGQCALGRAKRVRPCVYKSLVVDSDRGIDCPSGRCRNVPFLQRAFGTVGLSGADWLFCAAVASSVLWLREGEQADRACDADCNRCAGFYSLRGETLAVGNAA